MAELNGKKNTISLFMKTSVQILEVCGRKLAAAEMNHAYSTPRLLALPTNVCEGNNSGFIWSQSWISSIKEGVHYRKYELGETPVSR